MMTRKINIEMPLVTVLLPVFNRPKVVKTIHSVLNQTYSNIELIVIDNCSTDCTVEEINKINDKRIRLFVNAENKGQTFSLNRGLSIAEGKYIARIDSDDLMHMNRIKKQVEFLENHSDYVLCGSNIKMIDEDDEYVCDCNYCEDDFDIRIHSLFYCPFAHPAVMIRKSTLDENSIKYNLKYKMAEDYEMWICLLSYGKGYNLQECLTLYRVGASNDSVKYSDIMKKETINVLNSIPSEFGNGQVDFKKYKKLLLSIQKNNMRIDEILFTFLRWRCFFSTYFNKSEKSYDLLKKRLDAFIISCCVTDNSRLLVTFIRSFYHYMRTVFIKVLKK